VYLQMGNTPKLRGQAEQCFESAISRDPQSQEAYFGLGQLYERSGNYSVAAARFRKACDLDPSDEKALHYLGECKVHSGDTKEGNKLLAAASELESAKRDIDYLRKRLLAEPQSRDLHLRLARLLRKYEDHSESLSQYAAYQNLGAEDTAVRKEMEQYENELISKRLLPPRPSSHPATATRL
jgi:tetratricopeptide (TPR) repeat protein